MTTDETRYDVTLTDGIYVEKHLDLSLREQYRLVDFAWRHDLKAVVAEHRTRVRGEGTYR